MLTPRQRDRIWLAIYLDVEEKSPLEIARAIAPTATDQDVHDILSGFSGIVNIDRVVRKYRNESTRRVHRKSIPDEDGEMSCDHDYMDVRPRRGTIDG